MVNMNLLLSLTLIPLALAEIPTKDVVFQVIQNDIHASTALTLEAALNIPPNNFTSLKAEMITTAFTQTTGQIPYIGFVISGIISILKSSLAGDGETDWKKPLIKAIGAEIDSRISANDFSWINAKLITLEHRFSDLKKSIDDHDFDKNAFGLVKQIIDELIQQFSQKDAILKKFPLLALPPLFILASATVAFEITRVQQKIDENQAYNLPCQLADVIAEYRSLASKDRVKWLRADHPESKISDNKVQKFIDTVPYNPSGYMCSKELECDAWNGTCGYGCVQDTFNGGKTMYQARKRNTVNSCYYGVLKIMRHQVEEVFRKATFQLNSVCLFKKHEVRRRIVSTKQNRFPDTTDLRAANLLTTKQALSQGMQCSSGNPFPSWKVFIKNEFLGKSLGFIHAGYEFIDGSWAMGVNFKSTAELEVAKPYPRKVINETWTINNGGQWLGALILDKAGRPLGIFKRQVGDKEVFYVYHNNYWERADFSQWDLAGLVDESLEVNAPSLRPKCTFSTATQYQFCSNDDYPIGTRAPNFPRKMPE